MTARVMASAALLLLAVSVLAVEAQTKSYPVMFKDWMDAKNGKAKAASYYEESELQGVWTAPCCPSPLGHFCFHTAGVLSSRPWHQLVAAGLLQRFFGRLLFLAAAGACLRGLTYEKCDETGGYDHLYFE